MRKSHSFNFLLELLVVIVFFTLCSIVTVSMFAKASSMNTEATLKSETSIQVQNIVEELKMHGYLEETDCSNGCVIEKDNYEVRVSHNDNTFVVKAVSKKGLILEEVNIMYLGDAHE